MKKALYIIIPVMLLALVVIRLMTNKETARKQVYTYNKDMKDALQWLVEHFEELWS